MRARLAAGFRIAAGLLILGASAFRGEGKGGGPALLTGLAMPDGRLLGVDAALTGGTATPGLAPITGLKAKGGLIAPPFADWVLLEVGGG